VPWSIQVGINNSRVNLDRPFANVYVEDNGDAQRKSGHAIKRINMRLPIEKPRSKLMIYRRGKICKGSLWMVGVC
jgi:hypothetical protein